MGVPYSDDPRYTVVRHEMELDGTVHAAAENALDVPHTAYLHGGLFRTSKARMEIGVVLRRWHDRAEAEYIGESAPPGVLGRILAPANWVTIDRLSESSEVRVRASRPPYPPRARVGPGSDRAFFRAFLAPFRSARDARDFPTERATPSPSIAR